jgi:hypothetical protein
LTNAHGAFDHRTRKQALATRRQPDHPASMNMNRQLIGLLLLMSLLLSIGPDVPAQATPAQPQGTLTQPNGATPVERRAADLCAQFRKAPGDYEKLFAPVFLTQVPPDKLNQIFDYYFTQGGRCTQAKLTESDGALAGKFDLFFEQGYSVPATLSVNPEEPHLIAGLWLGVPVKLAATLAGVVDELKALPGDTNLLVVKLNANGPTTVIAHNAERELALGSAFKLYILSELVRAVNARERKWPDIVPLDARVASLPSGMLQTWPAGAPVTMHTLATMMISISDNTAADQLLATLGRERVEHMLAATGHAKPELDMPFLSTLEMFKLKGEPTGKAAGAYLALDAKARRAYLADTIAAVKREEVKPYADGKPAYVDKIEWFASAADMCRLLDWLRRQSETDQTARQILAINPGAGLVIPRDKWQYVGYKGGSEPGVLNLTYLLQSKKGDWYAFSIGWNNPQAALDNTKLFTLVQQVLQLIPT